MTSDDSLVALGPFAKVLVVDTSDIRTANGRSLHAKHHLAMAGLRNRHFSELHGAVAR